MVMNIFSGLNIRLVPADDRISAPWTELIIFTSHLHLRNVSVLRACASFASVIVTADCLHSIWCLLHAKIMN